MSLTKVLITVKTYPTLSAKYDELVCTAGFREDGTWIRIYPIPFRKLEYGQRYKKYQWIEIDLEKNTSDFRPESFKPISKNSEINLLDVIDTKNNGWELRKKWVLQNVYTDMIKLIADAKNPERRTSLAVFKPKEILGFVIEETDREWNTDKLNGLKARNSQLTLFEEENKHIFDVVKKLPYKFSYKFKGEDGENRKLMIEDWEIGVLYWNTLESSAGDEKLACQKVKEKYWDELAMKRDIYFYLGTTWQFHSKNAPNPFVIVGVFYPPKPSPQIELFL